MQYIAVPSIYAHLHTHVTRSTVCLYVCDIIYPMSMCIMIDVSYVFEDLLFKSKCSQCLWMWR